jgi:hypothetical protein
MRAEDAVVRARFISWVYVFAGGSFSSNRDTGFHAIRDKFGHSVPVRADLRKSEPYARATSEIIRPPSRPRPTTTSENLMTIRRLSTLLVLVAFTFFATLARADNTARRFLLAELDEHGSDHGKRQLVRFPASKASAATV